MRIASGALGGRRFEQPDTSAVRPLSNKVRVAIFDIYGDVTGARVLDAYAGSGAAGFEAASRGAAIVEAIEANAAVARVITANARELGLDWGYTLHNLKLETWLAQPTNQPGTLAPFDLIIADPPYERLDAELIDRLAALLAPGGVLALSQSAKLSSPELALAPLVKRRDYGDTALTFYRRAER